MQIALRYAARSNVGLGPKSRNEDSGYAGPHLLVLADGMGGHAAGDVASSMVVGFLAPLDEDAVNADQALSTLQETLAEANLGLGDAMDENPALDGMGTTTIAMLKAGTKLAMAHIGDSRAYLLREGQMTQITKDHSFVQQLVDSGRITTAEAEHHPQRSLVTKVMTGSPDDEPDRQKDEGPRHRVRLSTFEIAVTEVTQRQYREVTGQAPSDCDYGCGNDHPVQNLFWIDAARFLNTLSEKEGRTRCYTIDKYTVTWDDHRCSGYRLPTEAEWEYAARAGTTTAWSFGDDKAMLDAYAWTENNSGGTAHEVGRLGANPWGLYDVYGNVWEWVWDRTDGGSDNDTPVVSLSASSGPASGSGRVLRGGSFAISAVYTRSSYRDGNNPTSSYWRGGFRCVRGAAPGP